MSDRRLRLLVLTSTYPRWDGDSSPAFVADLCASLSDEMDVTVLAPASSGAASRERAGNVDVHRFAYSWPPSTQRLADGAILPNIRQHRMLAAQVPALIVAELWAAWRLVRSGRFDAIHAHWAVPQGVVAALLKRRAGVPVLTTTHGGDIYALRGGMPLAAKRWALQTSDSVTAVSSQLKREVVGLGVDARRVSVVPMGVDTRRFTPEAASESLRRELAPDGPLLLFVGRLVEKKGTRYAIEAMPAILRAQPGARLVMVGDGPERRALEAQAHELGVEDAVRFAGPAAHGDLPRLYASADVFIGPSVVERNGDTESFGLVFAEAQASGCPVIATGAGGISDVVSDGVTGTIVPQRDGAAIAAAAIGLLRDHAKRAAMGARGRDAMQEQFDQARTGAQYASLIKEIVA